jgi:hypothetical protein
MSIIKTESISSLNNLGDTNNIDLSDDGTTTFNGPIVADRVKAGSSNLQYDYRTRTTATVIPVPSWATDIEIDFFAFQATTAASYYSIIRLTLANSSSVSFSDFRLTYENTITLQSYASSSTGSGRWGSAAGSTGGSANILYLFQNTSTFQYVYTGMLRLTKVPYINSAGSTYIVYNINANGSYTGNGGGGIGVWKYGGVMYGAQDDPDDVISQISFGTNGTNNTHAGSFNAKFREEDPGTLITT